MKRGPDTRQSLLRHASTEVSAAKSLYAQGLLQQAALHLSLFWRSLLKAGHLNQGDESDSEEPSGELEPGTLLSAAAPSSVDPAQWEESVAEVNRLASREASGELEVPGAADQGEARRVKDLLDLQLQLAGRACREAHRGSSAHLLASIPRLDRGPWRLVIGVAALGALVVLVVTLTGSWARSPEAGAGPGETGTAGAVQPPTMVKFNPRSMSVTLARVSKRQRSGDFWNAPGSVVFAFKLRVLLPTIMKAGAVEVSVDHNDVYLLSFQRDSVELGTSRITPDLSKKGLRVLTIRAPKRAVSDGYDSILITGAEGDAAYSLGHLMLVE